MRDITLGLMLIAAAATAGAAQEPPAARRDQLPEIVVTGNGAVTLSPDYAEVQVSVVVRDAQAARAGQENARVMTAVRGALRSLLSVPDDSLPTVGTPWTPTTASAVGRWVTRRGARWRRTCATWLGSAR